MDITKDDELLLTPKEVDVKSKKDPDFLIGNNDSFERDMQDSQVLTENLEVSKDYIPASIDGQIAFFSNLETRQKKKE